MTSLPTDGSDLGSAPASAAGWSELVPRYVLIEEAVRGLRVLEVGARDLRPLARLSSSGATRVAATSENPERFDRSALRGRRIELIAMDRGQLDFEDRSFDVVL